jgi:hypothetical protein
MDIFSLKCIEINDNGGWYLVIMEFISNDPTIGTGSTMTFTITDASFMEVGKCYDLNLEEQVPQV